MRKYIRIPLLILAATILSLQGFAQRTAIYDQPQADFNTALELFNKEKYGAAKPMFLQVAEDSSDPMSEMTGSALYYAGLSATELFNSDAEQILMTFISRFPTHPGQQVARFQMGNLNYRSRKYNDAAGWYSSINGNQLTALQKNEFHFKNAYSHFMIEDYGPARQHFLMVKDPTSDYYAPAVYYYAHIAYLEGSYDTALAYFQRLRADNNFGPVIPYYITHILYLQERYDDLLSYAPALLEEATPRRAPEISRLIGEAHFRKEQFALSIPHLKKYIDGSGARVTRDDHYQIGFAYYSIQDFENAVNHLERATNANDKLAQNAWYHLAASYIETNQKRFARSAFMNAYQLPFIEEITRESLFNYAKLSFELSLDPYNEAILSFQKYINEYPDSERTPEAHAYLIDLYLTTSNYKEALSSIEKLNVNTPRLREAFQRIAYYRGVELFNNSNFSDAIEHFKLARRYTDNRTITALSLFWEGEAYYRLEQYELSAKTHESFLVSPGAFTQDIYNRANYSIGYAHFKQQHYNRAITAFRKFISDRNEDTKLLNDAHLRIADSYFISKNYQASLDFYDRAIRIGVLDNDYAVFQKALVFGVMGQFENKIATLQQFLNNYGRSTYASDAKYEMGNTWLILNNNANALNYFNQVVTQHPNSSHVKSSMLKTGLIYFNTNEDERALGVFKQVISKYPGTPESQEALGAIRNIYVSLNQVDEFFRYSENLGFANVSTAQQDSLLYVAAENRYMQGDCANAIRGFSNYIERYPNGIFILNAHYYNADCAFRSQSFDQALAGYTYVLGRPKSRFTENALVRASQIEFRRGNYEQAYRFYKQMEEISEVRSNLLEARAGQMRSLFRLHRYQDAIIAARSVLETEKVQTEINQEANLIIGKSALAIQDTETAMAAFKLAATATSNEASAEALYHMALIEYRKGNYETSENQIFDYINKIAAYDYWLARSFLLLADNYIEMGNMFQAKHTLQSIIDNYQGEDMRAEARKKLEFIEKVETETGGSEDPDTLEIDFGGGGN
jgi:TolA-binding protein